MVCLWSVLSLAQSPALWLDVPFVKQTRQGCGAASIAMVMQYWLSQAGQSPGETADAAYIHAKLYSKEGRGVYASAMESYLREQRFRTFSFRGSWDDLKQHLEKGRPLIVALKPSKRDGVLHYVVVAGIDAERNLVMYNDPADRKLAKLDRGTFEKDWDATDHWTLLALPESNER